MTENARTLELAAAWEKAGGPPYMQSPLMHVVGGKQM